jgi:DNA-binding beta-propeller fold protein YncE
MKAYFTNLATPWLLVALALLWSLPALAQEPGYVSAGSGGIQVFDPSTGQLQSPLSPVNESGTVAVSSDGSTVYVPVLNDVGTGSPGGLQLFSASTGQMLTQINGLSGMINGGKVVLSPGGGYAFVMCSEVVNNSVAIVNLAEQEVIGYVHVTGGNPNDIAISPNGKQFFVATTSYSGAVRLPAAQTPLAPLTRPVFECAAPGICVFDTGTFTMEKHLVEPTGFLAVSQDSNSLYLWKAGAGPFYVVNTSTFAVSEIALPSGAISFAMAIAPAGNTAVLSAVNDKVSFYYALDTTTNTVTASFPSPLLPPQSILAGGRNVVAFSADGSSIWTLGCNQMLACDVISGQSFPSGSMIAETSLGASYDGFSISF